MKASILLSLIIFTSCATFTDKDVVYKPQASDSKEVLITLKAKFKTQIGYKYASITNRNVMGSYDQCAMVQPGEGNDGYLKAVLCKTYYSLKKSFNVKLVSSKSQLDSNNVFNIHYDLKEGTSVGEQVWSWSNFLTLTIIPYRGKRQFDVSVEFSKSDSVINKMSNEGSFIEWRSIFLLPAMPFISGYQVATDKVLASHLIRIDQFVNENQLDKLK